jgi:hypothetical protein
VNFDINVARAASESNFDLTLGMSLKLIILLKIQFLPNRKHTTSHSRLMLFKEINVVRRSLTGNDVSEGHV